MMSSNNSFKILHWNCNGIRKKKVELFDYLVREKISIACLNETKLSDKIRFSHDQFNIIRLDKVTQGVPKGGVAIVIHKAITHSLLPSFGTELVEAVGIRVTLHNGQLLNIISAYLTGTASEHNYDAYRRDLRKLNIPNSILLGDLNSKHQYWGCQRSNRAGNVLYDVLMCSNFEIYPPQSPTYFPGGNRLPSFLDIVLSNSPLQFEPVKVLDDLGSDHLPIQIEFLEVAKLKEFNEVYCYNKADWIKYKALLNRHIDIKFFQLTSTCTTQDIDDRVKKLTDIMNQAASVSVPKVKIKPHKQIVDENIRTLIRQRRATKRHLNRTGHPLVRIMYNSIKRTVEQACQAAYNASFQRLLKKFEYNVDNNRKLWSMAKIPKR